MTHLRHIKRPNPENVNSYDSKAYKRVKKINVKDVIKKAIRHYKFRVK